MGPARSAGCCLLCCRECCSRVRAELCCCGARLRRRMLRFCTPFCRRLRGGRLVLVGSTLDVHSSRGLFLHAIFSPNNTFFFFNHVFFFFCSTTMICFLTLFFLLFFLFLSFFSSFSSLAYSSLGLSTLTCILQPRHAAVDPRLLLSLRLGARKRVLVALVA